MLQVEQKLLSNKKLHSNRVVDSLQGIDCDRLIYGLRYIGQDCFFYVGSTNNATRRIRSHVTKAKGIVLQHGIEGAGWNLQKHIGRNGFSNLEIVVIGKVQKRIDERFYEHFAISFFLMKCHPLVNVGYPMNSQCFERCVPSGLCEWIYPEMNNARGDVVEFVKANPSCGSYGVRKKRECERFASVLDFVI